MSEDDDGKDLYAMLELPRSANMEEIRAAFRKLAAKHHPDRSPGDPKVALRFRRINAAFQVLSDPEKKEQYDELTSPIQDFSALAERPPPSAGLAAVTEAGRIEGEPDARESETGRRRERRRVRKRRRAKWSVWTGLLVAAALLVGLLAVVVGNAPADGWIPSTTRGAQIQAPAATPFTPAPESLLQPSDESIPHGSARPSPAHVEELEGRAVKGDKWAFVVPPSWQEVTDAKGPRWQAPDPVDGRRPTVSLAVTPFTGEASEYFAELDRRTPHGVAVESEAWEHESRPDGLRRAARVYEGGTPVGRFLQYAIAAHGRGYELTCTGPDDVAGEGGLCERILGTLRIK